MPATLDRWRLAAGHSDEIVAERRQAVYRLLESMEIADMTSAVLAGASHPLPTALATLDAIHLATAPLWKEQAGKDITMATHDRALAIAAKAMGLPVVGA
jgi:hypothetical protein